jgi:DivIVA domain-containing protein
MTTAGQDQTPVGSTPRPDSHFTVKMRGYCRDQVDAHLRTLSAALADAEEACRLAELRAEIAESDRDNALAELRGRGGRIPEPRGAMTAPAIGLAVERARRAAECEAQQARLRAAREATLRLERARECAGDQLSRSRTSRWRLAPDIS